MSFVREFVRNPRQTGSIAASSPAVVQSVVDGLDLGRARTVVELGAGTGAVTAGLIHGLSPEARLVALEVNASFADVLRRRFPADAVDVVVRPASQLPALVRERRLGPVDAVVSALPWTLMSPAERQSTLDGVVEVLAPDGEFMTLTCFHQSVLGAGRGLRDMLHQRFGDVRRLPVVWAAVPPMLAYRCTTPRT